MIILNCKTLQHNITNSTTMVQAILGDILVGEAKGLNDIKFFF